MKLPNDLKKYRAKYILKRVIPCAVMLAVLTLVIALWGDIVFPVSDDYRYTRGLTYALVLAVPFVVTGVPWKLVDRSYIGTVTHESEQTVTKMVSLVMLPRQEIDNKDIIYIIVEKPNGKDAIYKLDGGESRHAGDKRRYKDGDRVFHLYGSKYTVVLPRPKDTHCQCAVCGNMTRADSDTCEVCGRTLIKDIGDVS